MFSKSNSVAHRSFNLVVCLAVVLSSVLIPASAGSVSAASTAKSEPRVSQVVNHVVGTSLSQTAISFQRLTRDAVLLLNQQVSRLTAARPGSQPDRSWAVDRMPVHPRVNVTSGKASAVSSHSIEFTPSRLLDDPTYLPIVQQAGNVPLTFNGVPFEYHGVDRWITRESGNPYPASEIIDLSGLSGTAIHMITYGSWDLDLPTGTTLGYAIVHYDDGDSDTIPLIVGQNTASWAYDRPEAQGCLLHDKIPQWEAYSWWTDQDSNYSYWAHNYYTGAPIQAKPLASLELAINYNAYQFEVNTGSPCYTPGHYNVGINGLTLQTSGEFSFDTIPPTISNVWWRQNGAGSTIVVATITDNVAVASASLWWNDQEFTMQVMDGDQYYAIVPQQLNGVVGHFRITAKDPTGNVGYWPSGGSQAERIRYLRWAGLARNTRSDGEPVNTATGSFYTQHQDAYAPAPGMPFEFKRTYNSIAGSLDGPLGFGWTHSYNMWLEIVDDPLLHGVVVHYADGRISNFEESGGDYTSPAGDNNILSHEGGGYMLLQPDQIRHHFDAAGKLTTSEDRNGNTVLFAYTGDNLTQITDAAGRVYALEYDGQHLIRITDVLGRTYGYTYDGNGNLETYTDPAGGVLRYAYDAEHWMLSITDPNLHEFVTNTYDDRGRVIKQVDASGSVSTFEYVDDQHVVFTDNEGNKTTYVYDAELRIIETIDARGYSTKYEYDVDNNPILVTDKGGHATAYTYDGMGNVLTRTDALSQAATFSYDGQNNLTYKKDEAGAETTYEYAAPGNLVRIHDCLGGDTRMTYDGRGLMLTHMDANGHTTEYAYDGQGNRTLIRNPLGDETRYEYDAMGRQTAMIDANNHRVEFEYNPADRLVKTTDAKGKSTVFVYDPVGNLRSVTDRRGFETTYEYNVNDSLMKVTDPLGEFTTYTYDLMYHRKSVTNRRGFTTSYDYDAVYNLIKITDPKGAETAYEFDPDGNRTKATDALTFETSWEYDALHRVVKMTDALGGVTEYGYDPVGRLLLLQDPKGGETRSEYDCLGRLVKLTDALGHVTTYTYDAVGNRLTTTNPRVFTTTDEYDAANQLIRETDPLGHAFQLAYDGVGNVTHRTDARGAVTVSEYDGNDNLARVTDALGGQVAYTYDEEDNQTSVTDQNGHTTATEYDPVANPFRVTLPLGQATQYAFDQNGNVVSITNAKGKVTSLTYDSVDLLDTRTDPLSAVTDYDYDLLGQMVKMTDAELHATDYRYDALGRLTGVTNALGGHAAYEYDPLGNLTAIVDANTHRTDFGVDLLGRRTAEVNPLGSQWRYEYDAAGNLIRRTDAKGVITDYAFDGDDRLTHTVYPSGTGVDFTYNENDNLIGLLDRSGRTAFAYDVLNRIMEARRTSGILASKALAYGYDPASNRTSITYPDGKVMQYAYNANDWLEAATDPIMGATTYEYDPVGLPLHIANPNSTWADYAYDDADRLVRLFNGKPLTSTDLVSSFDYTLDKVGNRVQTIEKVTKGQVITWTEDYTYDELYRLRRSVETPDYNPALPYISEFAYDAVGNRLSLNTNIQDKPNTPPLPEMVTKLYTYTDADQMLTAGPVNFQYDANGNRTAMSGPTRAIDYSYDTEDRLLGARTFDVLSGKRQKDAVLDYTYDGLGRRMQRGIAEKGVRKTADFLYDALGYDLMAQYLSSGNPRTTFYFRDPTRMLSRYEYNTEPGQWYSYHQDGLGSISAWTNRTGGSVQEYKYAPYGRLIDNNGPDNTSNTTGPHNSITFSGKLWDRETETYYFGARDYDPATGVWLTQDPYRGVPHTPVTLHRYQYVANNPTTLVDQDGRFFPFLVVPVAGAIIGAAVSVAPVLINDVGTSLMTGDWEFTEGRVYLAKAASGAVSGAIGATLCAGLVTCIGAGAAGGAAGQVVENLVMREEDLKKDVVLSAVAGGIGAGFGKYLFPNVGGAQYKYLGSALTKARAQQNWVRSVFGLATEETLKEMWRQGNPKPYQPLGLIPAELRSAGNTAKNTGTWSSLYGTIGKVYTGGKCINGGTLPRSIFQPIGPAWVTGQP